MFCPQVQTELNELMQHPDPDVIALGIRQPWAELILRGVKTIEVRSRNTNYRGLIYIYTSKKLADIPAAEKAIKKHGLDVAALPRGVVVGTVDIVSSKLSRPGNAAAACVPKSYLVDQFAWRLENPQRLKKPLTVKYLPYGVWFYPWKRKSR